MAAVDPAPDLRITREPTLGRSEADGQSRSRRQVQCGRSQMEEPTVIRTLRRSHALTAAHRTTGELRSANEGLPSRK